jgi:hypothetical protein
MHKRKHGIDDVNEHAPNGDAANDGTALVPSSRYVESTLRVAPLLAEKSAADAGDAKSLVAGALVRRDANGYISVPTSGASGRQAISAQQAANIAAGGGGFMIVDNALSRAARVALPDQIPSLATGYAVIQYDPGEPDEGNDYIHTYDADLGDWIREDQLPGDRSRAYCRATDSEWIYSQDGFSLGGSGWINLGSSGHPKVHAVDGEDHITASGSGPNSVGVLYAYPTVGQSVHLLSSATGSDATPEGAPLGAPLLSGGTLANNLPRWGKLLIAPTAPSAAGATPAVGDLNGAGWVDGTLGVVKTPGSVYLAFKLSSSVAYFVQLTAPD